MIRNMRNLLPSLVVIALAAFAVACGGDDDSPGGNGAAPDPTATSPAAGTGSAPATGAGAGAGTGSAPARTGTLTVGEESWTIVPAIQCGVFPGPQVHISGHAEGDESVEITIDLDESFPLKSVEVHADDDDPWWSAEDEEVTIEVDGRTVRGGGTFSSPFADRGTREGTFEITC